MSQQVLPFWEFDDEIMAGLSYAYNRWARTTEAHWRWRALSNGMTEKEWFYEWQLEARRHGELVDIYDENRLLTTRAAECLYNAGLLAVSERGGQWYGQITEAGIEVYLKDRAAIEAAWWCYGDRAREE